MQSAAHATCALVAVSAVHAQIRHKLVVRRLHTGWCPAHCFTAAMQDSLQKVLQSDPIHRQCTLRLPSGVHVASMSHYVHVSNANAK